MANIPSNKLMEIFESAMSVSATFRRLHGNNPCCMTLEGVKYYVYIKNLSSAHFTNPDVWRAQLTGIDALMEIKESDALFVLLGYDSERNVYAAWNPHMVKQRIGTAKSPSFYSRLSWQQAVAADRDFRKEDLKNDGEVLLFPREDVTTFMTHIAEFFPDTSEYVAMGSKRRSSANAAYKELVNTQRINEFARYLAASSYSHKDINDYTKAIKVLLPVIADNRRIFLAYDSLEQYTEASDKFLALDEIKKLDTTNGDVYSYAFPVFINFLQEAYGEPSEYKGVEGDCEDDYFDVKDEFVEKPYLETDVILNEPNENSTETDYETPYIDNKGILTQIANPDLIDKLRPDLAVENRRLFSALATVEEFYGDRFQNMDMRHWSELFNLIDWNNPYPSLTVNIHDDRQRATRKKIRVVFPSGNVVQEKQVVKTLLEVVSYAGAENVHGLGILMGNNPLITREVNQKYPHVFKRMNDDLYVNTCSDTPTKFAQIKQINNKLELGLTVAME